MIRAFGLVSIYLVMALVFRNAARAEEPSKQDLAKQGKASSAYVQLKDGSGSAFCIHSSGLFLTNHHVIEGNTEVTLVLNANQKEQKVVKAKVLRSDKEADLALLQADGVKDLPVLAIGGDDKLSEGADVVACGFPFGKGLSLGKDEYPAITVTFGKVTSLRQKSGELELIQFDVELHPGNSGGPILGSDGRVVGVSWATIKGTNFRFAIPARKVMRFLEQPAIVFQPPVVGADTWIKPVPFEVRAFTVPPSDKTFDVELVLRTLDGKEQKHKLKRVEDAYRAEVPLLGAPTTGALRVTLSFTNGSLTGTVEDVSFKIGGKAVKLSQVRRLQMGEKAQAQLADGSALEGKLVGLDSLKLRIGEQDFVVDPAKATEAIVGAAGSAQAVRYTISIAREGKELAKLSDWLINESQLRKVYLMDLAEAEFKKGPWDLGKGVTGDPLARTPISVGGVKSPKGLGTHPNCSVSYRLKKDAILFRSKVGIDDSGRDRAAGEITFEVLGDGKVLWTSKSLYVKGDTDECSLDVSGVDVIELRVSVKGTNFRAHSAWLEPHVLMGRE